MAVKRDGQRTIIQRSIKSLLKSILKESSIDISSLRKNYCDIINRKNLIPIPLRLDSVLIPVKVRKTIGVNDGSYGYVDLPSIKEVSGGKDTVVTLNCGFEINCLETQRTIRARMRMGKLVKERYASRLLSMDSLRGGVNGAYMEYCENATRADIMLLIYEVMQLKREIEKQNSICKSGGV